MISFSIYASRGAKHQCEHAAALAQGFAAHGIQCVLKAPGEPAESEHVACWGWRQGQRLRGLGHQVLVMERGYLGDRFAWTSLAWNGLNNRGMFSIPADLGDRFERHFSDLLQPWSPGESYALLIGQVPGDMSLQGRDLGPWYREQAIKAASDYGLPIRFRPHPMAVRRGMVHTVPGARALDGSLADALSGARAVLTFNSNTAVDSLLAGKPTVACEPGAMAWGVASAATATTKEPDRLAFFKRLAWCQWSMDEIRSGAAWDVVRLSVPYERAVA